jgi:hypothetical protein
MTRAQTSEDWREIGFRLIASIEDDQIAAALSDDELESVGRQTFCICGGNLGGTMEVLRYVGEETAGLTPDDLYVCHSSCADRVMNSPRMRWRRLY